MRLASQIMVMLLISLGVYALWYGTRDGEPSRQIHACLLTACMAVVSLPILVRGATMLFTRRWLIGLVCVILGPLLCMGLFMLGAHAVRWLINGT